MSKIVDRACEGIEVEELTEKEAWALLDDRAHQLLGITGAEFVERWESGWLPTDEATHNAVIRLSMLVPEQN